MSFKNLHLFQMLSKKSRFVGTVDHVWKSSPNWNRRSKCFCSEAQEQLYIQRTVQLMLVHSDVSEGQNSSY
jgi:hypothetical protein